MTHHTIPADQVPATFTVATPQLPGHPIYKEDVSARTDEHFLRTDGYSARTDKHFLRTDGHSARTDKHFLRTDGHSARTDIAISARMDIPPVRQNILFHQKSNLP